MGTRSNIIVAMRDGSFARIYCHYDGYLSHNGRILADHYRTQAAAERLIHLGDLSSLAEKPSKPAGHSFTTPVSGHCVAYGRDRGEADSKARVFDSLAAAFPEADSWTEFVYVWQAGEWFVASSDEGTQALVPVRAALANGSEAAA